MQRLGFSDVEYWRGLPSVLRALLIQDMRIAEHKDIS